MCLKPIRREEEAPQEPSVAAAWNRQTFRIAKKKQHRDLQSLEPTGSLVLIVAAAAAAAVEAGSRYWLNEATGGPLNPLCSESQQRMRDALILMTEFLLLCIVDRMPEVCSSCSKGHLLTPNIPLKIELRLKKALN